MLQVDVKTVLIDRPKKVDPQIQIDIVINEFHFILNKQYLPA